MAGRVILRFHRGGSNHETHHYLRRNDGRCGGLLRNPYLRLGFRFPAMRTKAARFTLAVVACTLAACSSYSKVREKRPQFRPITGTVGVLANAQREIFRAMQRERRDPLAALGGFIAAAETASKQLQRNPGDGIAKQGYNFAVGRIIQTIRDAKLNPWAQPLHVPAAGGDFVLTHRPDPRPQWNPALYDFTPADQFDIRGTYVTERTVRDGIGAPAVATGKNETKDWRANFGMRRVFYGVTMVARFEGRRCVLSFEDPLAAETTSLGGRTYPLAADFTVPMAVMLAKLEPKKLELTRLLRPEKYEDTAGIARLQPYDPNKRVVLMIHGLMDSPATWAPMINALRGDADIRKNYQFWFYSYPSGYPYPYSASILRRELDAVESKFPLNKPMVVIGHSMGGCISRLLITDTSDKKLWMKLVKVAPEQVKMPSDDKKLLTDMLIFRHRKEVGRAILISAPLRGSDLASNWLGRLGAKLVHPVSTLQKVGSDLQKAAAATGRGAEFKSMPNSVDTMRPDLPFVKAINTVPIAPGVRYHTVVGDRGKGGNPDHTKPVRSDGIVPYWSSHLDGAESELIVPSNHSAHQNPQTIAEVRRILTLGVR